ncbi:galactokinase [Dinochytrium kinnereticum]|nr:galactokinase [Dinochytrium kinnereticum]
MTLRAHVKDGRAMTGFVEYIVALQSGQPILSGTTCMLIDALSEAGKFRIAKNLAEHVMTRSGPKAVSWDVKKCVSNLIMDCLKKKKMEHARDLIESLKSKGIALDVRVYTKLLDLQLAEGRLNDAVSVLNDIKAISPALDPTIYGVLVSRCLSGPLCDRFLAESMYREMVGRYQSSSISGTTTQSSSSSSSTSASTLSPSTSPASKSSSLSSPSRKILPSSAVFNLTPDTNTLFLNLGTLVLSAHANAGDYESTANLLNFIISSGAQLDVAVYTTIIKASSKAEMPDFSERWFKEIVRQGLLVDRKALHALMTAYVRANMLNLAMQIYEEILKREGSAAAGREPSTLHFLNVLLQAVPNDNYKARMTHLTRVLQEVYDQKLRPDCYTYSIVVKTLVEIKQEALIMSVFKAAVADARAQVKALEDCKDFSHKRRKPQPFPLSYALYTQVIHHLRIRKDPDVKQDIGTVLSAIREFSDHAPLDGVSITSLLRCLRSCGAFLEAVETYHWFRTDPRGLLAFNHPKCDPGLSFNRCLHTYLYAYIKAARGEKDGRIVDEKWITTLMEEMISLTTMGYPISERNWQTFCGLIIRFKRSPFLAVRTLEKGLRGLITEKSGRYYGKGALPSLRITGGMLSTMLMGCKKPKNKGWMEKSDSVEVLDKLERTLQELKELDAGSVDPDCFPMFEVFREKLKGQAEARQSTRARKPRMRLQNRENGNGSDGDTLHPSSVFSLPAVEVMSEEFPPTFSRLEDVYAADTLPIARARYEGLRSKFIERFGQEPQFYARSPGRVNIIGEHIDYCGFSVLPMAIARDVIIAVAESKDQTNPPRVTVTNIDAKKYPDNTFDHDGKTIVDIDASLHEWSNYFKCGYKGAFEVSLASGKSLDISIDGNVPAGAGVSSSSAFVCASALATLTASGKTINKGELAQTAIRSERYCGVQSGGMDQSISIMGNTGSALLIHFVPKLAVEPIRFPPSNPGLVFVIANTLVTADKHTTAPTNYNLRVVETRLAAAILAKHLGLEGCATLRDVQDKWAARESAGGKFGADGKGSHEAEVLGLLEGSVDAAFKNEKYSREEAAQALGITVAEMEAKFVGSIVIRCDGFELKKRARHVFSEAKRVFQFRDVCSLKVPYSGDLLKDLGDLMNGSQASCRDDFNCSCPELDELTSICRSAGAFGSRLTGAGWGGCSVSLVAEPTVASFIQKVTEEYYYKRVPGLKEDPNAASRVSDWIFASRASSGAAVLKGLTL